MSDVWLVTGASRGLGRAIVEAALAAGHRVVATARNTQSIEGAFGDVAASRLLGAMLDVTDLEQAHQVAQAAVGTFGRVDVLVNTAGYGQFSAFEETTAEEVRAQLGRVLVELANTDKPPVHFPVGRDAVEVITEHHRHVLDEIDAWRGLSETTSYDEASTRLT